MYDIYMYIYSYTRTRTLCEHIHTACLIGSNVRLINYNIIYAQRYFINKK